MKVCLKKKERKYNKNSYAISYVEKNQFFSISDFRHCIDVNITRFSSDEFVAEIKGLDLPFANSIRRMLLGDVETLCIDKVFFYENSSIMNDEMIAHRLGLIPISIDSSFLKYLSSQNEQMKHKIFFELKTLHPRFSSKKTSVYSNLLTWKPYGLCSNLLKNFKVKPVFRDILILKLNPGQKIHCECHCQLGKGSVHAKFSPVATAFYRIFPKVKILKEITDENAMTIFNKCPVKVFSIRKKKEKRILYTSSPKYCTFCKECLGSFDEETYPIKIGREKDKITFVIESTGVMSPEKLFSRAVLLLVGKCNKSVSVLLKHFDRN
jgi:DNA-directed RNA polymerase I and III subunit RPAC1